MLLIWEEMTPTQRQIWILHGYWMLFKRRALAWLKTLPFVVLALAGLACTIQTQAAARPAELTPTPQAAVMATNTPTPTTAPTQPPQPTATPERCTVSTGTPGGFLNLRAGPGTAYQVLQVLHEGDRLTVTNRAGGWVQVQAGGAVGWVYAQYCEVQR
ncbi:MAG TPA: SH3 domain-containing protein [Anaerolineales bacterium]|nr:SH3 domain-containing protein [Anaerolineales bacterium]